MTDKMIEGAYRRKRKTMLGFAALALIQSAGLWAVPAMAQTAPAQANFAIPAGPVRDALRAFAATTNLQLVYSPDVDATAQSAGVSGSFSPAQALARLLAGTGLTFRFANDQTVTIEKLVTADGGERLLGAVRVEGAQGRSLAGGTSVNGMNGSRDVTATEGTGSYTTGAMTIGSKMAATIQDVPRAVSVLTDQQMKDQNLTSVTDAMKALPGVIAQGETLGQPTFYSRGFQITTFQIDGGAPLQVTPTATGNFNFSGTMVPNMDMSLYDHVELVRGAAGTFNGFGNPGGVVNLVRKKPLDHNQLLLDFQLGSFNLHRVSADVTGPLAFDGKLRGRLIATHQDNDFFYSIADSNKNLVSATLEYDLTPTILVSIGANYDEQQMMPWLNGLMRDVQGNLISVPRSTCFCRPGAGFDTKTSEYFARMEQEIGDNWSLNYKATYAIQDQDYTQARIDGVYNEDPARNQVTAGRWEWSKSYQRRLMQEITLSGAFTLFGMDQKIVSGVNYTISKGSGDEFTAIGRRDGVRVDPLNYDPYQYGFDGRWIRLYREDSELKQFNSYISSDIQIIPKLHALVSGNITRSDFKIKSSSYCHHWFIYWYDFDFCSSPDQYGNDITFQLTGNDQRYITSGRTRISWPPSASLRYDLSPAWTLYGTYADIRLEQSTFLTADRVPLDPITGGNFEGGVKWAPKGSKFNMSLSGYYIRQRGFAAEDCHQAWMVGEPDFADYVAQHPALCTREGDDGSGATVYTQCCYIGNPDRQAISYGLDLEVSGEVRRGWQISASYTFNRNINKDPNARDSVTGGNAPLLGYSPRHLYKLSTSYAFSESSRLRGLSAYLGLQGQSETFIIDSYCPQPADSVWVWDCPGGPVPVHFTSPGWAVMNMGGAYTFNRNLSLQLNIDNVFDKHYLATVGGLRACSESC